MMLKFGITGLNWMHIFIDIDIIVAFNHVRIGVVYSTLIPKIHKSG